MFFIDDVNDFLSSFLLLSSPVSRTFFPRLEHRKAVFQYWGCQRERGGQDVRVTIAESLICFALLVLICFKTEPYRFIPT